jgi:DNA polymerase (family 10)
MDSRTAAHTLELIAQFLELKGENQFKVRAYAGAANGIRSANADDLAPLYESGELGKVRGLGPATLAVVRDLIETGESRYLEELRASMPEGLVTMLEVPGLTPARIHTIYETLNVDSIDALEEAARDGRLAKLPRFGPKTAAKILDGIGKVRLRGNLRLFHHAAIEAHRIVEAVRSHPAVVRAEVAGAARRCMEIAGPVVVVAACRNDPRGVAQSFTRISGVRTAVGDGAAVSIDFVDGARQELRCFVHERYYVEWFIATGDEAHVDAVFDRLAARRITVEADQLLDRDDTVIPVEDEAALYRLAGLAFVEPEMREALGEIDLAARNALPRLVEPADIRGVLHCHTHYSDGKASVREMADAARARGWSYIGITDHSTAAAFAGGLRRDKVLAQHEEIDELNAVSDDGFRILKGIEADILADGALDPCDGTLDNFDFVVGSVHSRFAMDETAMTDRILAALGDPRLTILGHPTGRKLLARDPYAVDLRAVLERAAEVGVSVELNSDPRRLDLDWRHLMTARKLGISVEIGPDAHSVPALDNVHVGVALARKAWLTADDVLNTRSTDDILAFARRRRATN